MKMKNQTINDSTSKQISWLQTWKTKNGAYNGYVVHRHDLKRMLKTHDTPWSQGPIISGYINLFQKTKDQKWLREAINAADLQCKRLHNSGKYIYAGFEDDRFSSLVHNSLANCSLLDLATVLIEEGQSKDANKYLRVVEENINKYIIGVLWDEKFGAFKFSKIDHYSVDKTRFVVNMNSVTVESLIKLSNLTGNNKYNNYALRIGKWILTEQVESSGLENGGISYSHVQPRVLILIYTALAMRGLDDLYYLTGDLKYLEMMKKGANHLINSIDPETNLFYHAIIDGKLVKYPQFVAGAGIILKALDDTEKLTGNRIDYQTTLNTILKKQLQNGGFSNFIGYNSLDNGRLNAKKCEVWEDIVPVMGWNAHMFEYLTRKVENFQINGSKTLKINKDSTVYSKNKDYVFRETKKSIFIIEIRPINSFIIFFALKKLKISLFYISLKKIMLQFIPYLPRNFVSTIRIIFCDRKLKINKKIQ